MNDKNITELLRVLELIQKELADSGHEKMYTGVCKSINILKNRNRNGYPRLNQHLLDDFRRLYDNRHDNDFLNQKFDIACRLSEGID